MKGLIAVMLMFCLVPQIGGALDVKALVNPQNIGLQVGGVGYPDNLAKDLSSGLATRIVFIVGIVGLADIPTRMKRIEITSRFDLWKERFNLVTSYDQSIKETGQFQSIDKLLAALQLVTLENVFPVADLPIGTPLTLQVQMLINPVTKQRYEHIRTWVNRNSVAAAGEAGNANAGRIVNMTWFNRIFNHLTEVLEAAPWQAHGHSESFMLKK